MPILLQINITANWGSTGKIAEQIGQCAISHGWKSYIAYGRMMNPSKNRLIKIGSKFDVYEHYIESRILDNEGLASRRATKKFIKILDEIKPDVVHLHNIHDHFLNYRLLFCYLMKRKIPVVWTMHDLWAITGHCMYIPCGCMHWKDECHNCPLIQRFSLDHSRKNHRLKKKLLASIQSLTIVPVSEWLADNIRQSCLKDRPIKVIHNGIDIHTFSPQNLDIYEKYGINKKKKIILGVAVIWNERKGLNDFYELAHKLDPDKYTIVIVGKLIEDVKKIKVGCQMIFVKQTQNALELAQLYSSALVFVNPTYQDNYPTTNLEAIACGTPVITYRTGGSPEAVNEKTGIVIEQGDINALVAAIQQITEHPLSEVDCRRNAEKYFDKDKCFVEYLKLYKSLIDK